MAAQTTAQKLGQFKRELRAEGFPDGDIQHMVRGAFDRIMVQAGGVTISKPEAEQEHTPISSR